MVELILSLVGGAPAWLIYVIAGAFGVLGVYFKGRSDGKGVEKSRQTEANTSAKSFADEIDAAVAGREPQTNRERLSKWSR
ncbi:hypothetical protein [Ochrobactrum sp. AP1BH01-1]|jgi:flagellar biosynthesis component FlhA|uniref:hypothetical protein n=1 Tax=Ochrobactrum sp. AP1BH01-1 TaxID=2823874 RepID=UPI001B370040|nr:hypothetical protein [Ochrobactrum sp. AP1BH01-1]MBQ0707832.1 hypothetical protein [Ochrobactrum sp. AP1BH01-1]